MAVVALAAILFGTVAWVAEIRLKAVRYRALAAKWASRELNQKRLVYSLRTKLDSHRQQELLRAGRRKNARPASRFSLMPMIVDGEIIRPMSREDKLAPLEKEVENLSEHFYIKLHNIWEREVKLAEVYERLKLKYQRASRYPFLSVGPDPPMGAAQRSTKETKGDRKQRGRRKQGMKRGRS